MMKDRNLHRAIDTEADAEQVQFEIVRRTPVWKKFSQIVELNRTLRALALADIRRQHPHADESAVRRLYAMRRLPSEIVEQVYGNGSGPQTGGEVKA
jgi:hypothetical protein